MPSTTSGVLQQQGMRCICSILPLPRQGVAGLAQPKKRISPAEGYRSLFGPGQSTQKGKRRMVHSHDEGSIAGTCGGPGVLPAIVASGSDHVHLSTRCSLVSLSPAHRRSLLATKVTQLVRSTICLALPREPVWISSAIVWTARMTCPFGLLTACTPIPRKLDSPSQVLAAFVYIWRRSGPAESPWSIRRSTRQLYRPLHWAPTRSR